MTIKDEIAILDLLRRREAEFVRVWQCESGVCRLLGLSAFPFGGAPELPSRQKAKRVLTLKALRGRAPRAAATAAPDAGAPAIRKLAPGEDAYRVVYNRGEGDEASFQRDTEVIRKLFQLEGGGFAVLSVETVAFRSLEDWRSIDVLWKRRND